MNKDSTFKSPVLSRFNMEKGTVTLTEVRAYTGDDVKTAQYRVGKAKHIIAEEWNKIDPKTPDEIDKFYKETDGYIYDLYAWTHDKEMWDLLDKKITGNERVLDYGCGICDVSIYLAEKGCDVVAVDIPGSKTLQFGMWRVYQRGLGDKIKFTFDPDEKFDVVLAVDVLEHVMWPLRYIIRLTRHLKEQASWFFCTPRFYDGSGTHPMHLRENFWLVPQIFGQVMVSMAFKPDIIVKDYFPIWYPFYMLPPTQVEGSDLPLAVKKT